MREWHRAAPAPDAVPGYRFHPRYAADSRTIARAGDRWGHADSRWGESVRGGYRGSVAALSAALRTW
jgi:hypothetical protein